MLVMTKFMINNRTDAWKTGVNLLRRINFFRLARKQLPPLYILVSGFRKTLTGGNGRTEGRKEYPVFHPYPYL